MPTRPMTQRPWPRNAEWARKDAVTMVRGAREQLTRSHDLLMRARKALDDRNMALLNELLSDTRALVSDSRALLSDIERVLEVARIGVEPADDAPPTAIAQD